MLFCLKESFLQTKWHHTLNMSSLCPTSVSRVDIQGSGITQCFFHSSHKIRNQWTISHAISLEYPLSVNVACMQNEGSVPSQENTSVKDRRKTVVEVCEKIIFDGHSKIGALKSPPPTSYIEVPNIRVVPLHASRVHTKSYCPLFVSNAKCVFCLWWVIFLFSC